MQAVDSAVKRSPRHDPGERRDRRVLRVRPDLAALRRTYSLRIELAILAATLAVWQILRIPFEGSRREALAHARDWLAAERALGMDIEPALIRFVNEHEPLRELAHLAYGHLHIAVVVGLLAAAHQCAPDRYPTLRTTFVLAHVPALLVLAAYPLAPPKWLVELPFAEGPPHDLADLRNLTAAAVSLHFGYTVFVAGAALSLWPRSPFAWVSVLYPPLIFAVIVGSGNHFVFDAVAGTACFGAALAGARVVHRRPSDRTHVATSPRRAAGVAAATALVGLIVNGLVTGGLRPAL